MYYNCRGPAKGYIEALENRLLETERILLQLLPTVSTEHLSSACFPDGQSLNTLTYSNGQSQGVGLAFPKKVGIEYWASFPLASVSDVRRWQADRFRDCGVEMEDHGMNGHRTHVGPMAFSHHMVGSQVNQPSSQPGLSADQPNREIGPNFDQQMLSSPALDIRKSIDNRGPWPQVQDTSSASTGKDPERERESNRHTQSPAEPSSYPEEGIMPEKFKREFLW